MRFKKIWVHKHFFQSKIILDIPKKEEGLEEEIKVASINQTIDQMKRTS